MAVDHLLGKSRPMSYKAIPGVVYTNPEIAGVGKTEEELQAEGISYTVKKYRWHSLGVLSQRMRWGMVFVS